jgi:type IV pilus secretin PilQ/predicted competence protein
MTMKNRDVKRMLTGSAVAAVLAVSILPVAAQWSDGGGGQPPEAAQADASYRDDVYIDYFDVNNADLRSVFRQLSEFSGVDIVLDKGVKGVVTLTVTNKTWKEILHIVCKIADLMPIRQETYILVVTKGEYRKAQMDDAEAVQKFDQVGPLNREIVRLNNMPAGEMLESIKPLLSERGRITVVERNNALVIFDTKENITAIKKMINELDIETEQISISCKIIEVGSGVIQDLGVQWGYFDQVGPGASNPNVTAEHLPGASVVASPLERMTYGVLSQDKLAVTLEYLFQESRAQVVAQPQITTVQNKEARVFMGQQIPVTYLDEAGNTTIKMMDAGTELTVTPHLTNDKRIMLALTPTKKSHEFRGFLPIINEQSAQTNVVVDDGETVVIAGLTSNEMRESEGGIPFLKDIPLLGHLFKRTHKSLDKKDLVIFVTPHIISKRATPVSTAAESR